MKVFEYIRHPRVVERQASGPTTVDEQRNRSSSIARFNAAIAVKVTRAVGSMWCAYVFAGIALIGLPGAISAGTVAIVQWVAQTFLQLVLLSVIIVGQNVQAGAADKRALDTFTDAEAILHEAAALQLHLAVQDKILIEAIAKIRAFPIPPLIE